MVWARFISDDFCYFFRLENHKVEMWLDLREREWRKVSGSVVSPEVLLEK